MKRSGLVHAGMHYNRHMKPQIAILILAGGLACTTAWGLAAGERGAVAAPAGTPAAAQAGGLSLDEAVARAEQKYDARVVRAEEKLSGDRRVYHVRLLSDDGRVFDVTVDAETGRIE